MVPPASHEISRASWYSGYFLQFLIFAYRIITFCDLPSQVVRLIIHYVMKVLQPQHRSVGLGCSLFARRYWGNRFCFLFLRVLRCFSSPGCLRIPIDSVYDVSVLPLTGFPIRISTCLSLLAAQRSFSQLTASFFGS